MNHDKMKACMDKAVEIKELAGLNLLVLQDGEEVFYGESGYANVAEKKPFQRDTICRLYSMSKPVTAAAAMLLLQDGIIDYCDPVSKFLPSFANQEIVDAKGRRPVRWDRPVLIKDLLNMTSGLVYPFINTPAEVGTDLIYKEMIDRFQSDHMMTTAEFADRLGKLPLQFQPGEQFQYGTSADVLGAVIEAVSGMSFGEFLEKRLFAPLEMKDTAFYVPEEKKDRYAMTYICRDGEVKEYVGNNLGIRDDGKKNAFESGGAGLFSTVDDYAAFARMLMAKGSYKGQQILSPKAVEFMSSAKLTHEQRQGLAGWTGLEGFSYGNLMRIMVEPERASIFADLGEYGWDGWLGPYFCNAPKSGVTILMMTQCVDYGTGCTTRKLHNLIFS